MLINSPNISGSLTVTGNAVITGSLTVAGGINATITGSATTASYVEYSNVANKPTLVSGSSQVSFNGITDKPTLVSGSSQVTYSGLSGIPAGIVSGSAQVSFNGITDKPTLVSGSEQVSFNGIVDKPTLVSGSSQVTYSGLSGIPSGIVSSSAQVGGYGIFATTGSNSFNGSQVVTGSLTVTGQVVAQTLNVQQVTSSIVFSSGSNIFGNSLSNTQQFTGSLQVSGSSHYVLGNVGIGTSSPQSNLQVLGTIKVATGNAQGILGLGEANGTTVNVGLWRGAANAPTTDGNFLNLGGYEGIVLATGAATIGSQTERMRITSGGNVLIGTATAPSAIGVNDLLVIGKSGSASNAINFSNGSTTNWGYLLAESGKMVLGSGTSSNITFETNAGSERMRITSGGNVGIGTTSPVSTTNYIFTTTNGSNGSGYITQVGGTTALYVYSNANDSRVAEQRALPLIFETSGTERMRITAGGNVGIGSNSPSEKLEVQDGYLSIYHNANADTAGYGVMFYTNGGGSKNSLAYILLSQVGTARTGNLIFATSNAGAPSEKMRITSGGNVGIGTTPSYKLDITNSVAASTSLDPITLRLYNGSDGGSAIYFQNSVGGQSKISFGVESTGAGTDDSYLGFSTGANTALTERMRITSGGDLLVGCTSVPGAGGTVQGISLISSGAITALRAAATVGYFGRTNAGELFAFYHNTAQVGNISVTTSATAFNTSSDYRLKTDFKEFNALSIIDNIKTYDYAWKIDSTRAYGVKAHELQEILPYIVYGEKDELNEDGSTKPQAVDYSKLVPILIKSIQEQQSQIEILKTKIEILEQS